MTQVATSTGDSGLDQRRSRRSPLGGDRGPREPFTRKWNRKIRTRVMVRSIVALSWSAAWYQVRCVRNVADHLTEDGTFVTEMYVPDPARFDRGQRIHVRDIESVVLEVSQHDPEHQRVRSQLIALQHQAGEHDPRLRASQLERAGLPGDLERPKDAETHGPTVLPAFRAWNPARNVALAFTPCSVPQTPFNTPTGLARERPPRR